MIFQYHINLQVLIQINQPTKCSSFSSLLLDVYVQLNMFRAPLRPSSGAYCTSSLWFYRWSVVVAVLLDVSGPTTTNSTATTTFQSSFFNTYFLSLNSTGSLLYVTSIGCHFLSACFRRVRTLEKSDY
jgi:hypothetical protein